MWYSYLAILCLSRHYSSGTEYCVTDIKTHGSESRGQEKRDDYRESFTRNKSINILIIAHSLKPTFPQLKSLLSLLFIAAVHPLVPPVLSKSKYNVISTGYPNMSFAKYMRFERISFLSSVWFIFFRRLWANFMGAYNNFWLAYSFINCL